MITLFKSGQIITSLIKLGSRDEVFLCSFIYASNDSEERKLLWRDLRSQHLTFKNWKLPWILCGDFNVTIYPDEESSIRAPRSSSGMDEFESTTNFCRLQDIPFHGPKYTWCNKRQADLICKKLDRGLASDDWFSQFPHSYCVFEAGGCSDHLRGRVMLDSTTGLRKSSFKFVNALLKNPSFLPKIQEFWQTTTPIFVSTTAIYKLSKQLKALKPYIRSLIKDSVTDLERRTGDAYSDLCTRQRDHLSNPSSHSLQEEVLAYEKWLRLSDLEEDYLKQKSKLHWLAAGDQNNSTFYRSVSVRQAINSIREVKDKSGVTLSSRQDIHKEAIKHFSDLLKYKPPSHVCPSVSDLQGLTRFRCSPAHNLHLLKPVTNEEIKETLFHMPNYKSPGPDGFTSEFFKSSWSFMGHDFLAAVRSFFEKGFLPKGINSTTLVLIPKKDGATTMSDYRPISLCNVLYKVISKIIANRLKELLPNIIRGNQSAFIKNRMLMENVLMATELIKDYHKDSISPRCTLKIDISKAFDSVQWEFLLNSLEAMNFPPDFCHWIRLCISTASFSIQINGENVGYFNSARGLRQGCPLSPYLFVLSLNVLSIMLDEAAEIRKFGYHPRCKITNLTHLCFADDLLIFMEGTTKSFEGVMAVVDSFAIKSGLTISLPKSTILSAGMRSDDLEQIVQRFNLRMDKLPVRYLGLPLLTRKMSPQDYLPLLDKIKRRINSWTGRFLSYAGRVQLIKSVLGGLINFWSSAFRLPSGCIKQINSICSAFLWSGTDTQHHKAKVSWIDVCKTKAEGGLSMHNLMDVNKVCTLKLLWRLLSKQPTPWVSWVWKNLIRKGSIWEIKRKTTLGSWMWKKILKMRPIAQEFYRVNIHNGKSTSFWFDLWHKDTRLFDVLGSRGTIDLGVPTHASIYEAISLIRERQHRIPLLNEVVTHLRSISNRSTPQQNDISLWKISTNQFKDNFKTKYTLDQIRCCFSHVPWWKGIWFSLATPKFQFITWLAARERLLTGDQICKWNRSYHPGCILCGHILETRNHLFFECTYSSTIWLATIANLPMALNKLQWDDIITFLASNQSTKVETFLARYSFQTTIYAIWNERNARKHGHLPSASNSIIMLVDKRMRNKLSTLRHDEKRRFQDGMTTWFESRL